MNKKQKIAAFSCCIAMIMSVLPVKGGASGFSGSVSAQSAVLISGDTGSVLFEKSSREPLAMASTTKIMTALLTVEEARRTGDPVIEITPEMVAVEGSSMGLKAGDKLTLTGLAAGMLLASGNDAANAAALAIAGDQEGFARLMNERAAEISMEDTHFVTPSGLDDEEHYSTAYDMALLAREALKNPVFSELAASRQYAVEFYEPDGVVNYYNHNKLLSLYDGCIGVKTGFTKKAGRCLVSAAEREGVTLIAVTLNAPDDWNDHIAMLDYGFSALEAVSFDESGFTANVPVVGGEKASIVVRGCIGGSLSLPKEDGEKVSRKVFLPAFMYAPIEKGDKIGEVRHYIDEMQVYAVPIVAEESALYLEKEPGFWEKLTGRKE